MRRDDVIALKEERARLHKQMLDMFSEVETREENRGAMTSEEKEKFDKMEAEFRALTKRSEKAEELLQQEEDVKKALNTPLAFNVTGTDEVPMTLAEYRTKTGQTKPWDTAEYRSAWFHFLTTKRDADLDIEEQRVLSKASAGAGANLVPTSFYNEIINILRFTGPIQQLASVMTTDSGETLQIPAVSAHGVATWTAENAAYTASDETFGQISLGAFKAGRTVIVSEELLTDAAFGLESYLAQELGDSIGVLEETAFATGDGSGKPLGIATTGNGVTVSQAATGNATNPTYSAIINWVFALPYQYRRNAAWVVSDSAVKSLYLMVDSQNRPLWNVNLAGTGPDTFAGYPVYTSPDFAATGASAKIGVFGDIRQAYQIRRVNGFALQRQSELYSNNGQVGFRGFERVDGRIRNAAAAIVLQQSAT